MSQPTTITNITLDQFCAKLHDAIMDKHGDSVPVTWQTLDPHSVAIDVGGDIYAVNLLSLSWMRMFFV